MGAATTLLSKACTSCGRTKPIDLFPRRACSPDGLQARCKFCLKAWRLARHKEDPVPQLLRAARARAKRSGLPFNLTAADVQVPRFCPVLGIPLRISPGVAGPNSPSLDRIDSAKGYTPGNVVVVSWRCNSVKKNATPDELERIAAFYRQLVPK